MSPADLKASRERLGLTAWDLAAILSSPDYRIDERLVRRWEAGTRPIPSEVAAWLGRAADVPEPKPDWYGRALPAPSHGDMLK